MASMAREAGVAIATVFRGLPAKEELVADIFDDRMDASADAVTAPIEEQKPGVVSSAASRPPARCRPPTAGSPTS
ncbi:hypothetical protein [Streptomyces sp. SAI-127]|uniref:hypothetical protein n=1 Tax=Streptomyces sp. SAI-127 TaxID=2940543 RepID=UPI002476AC44|nr:hypothetical protein [Streptomyces sp. SAI-127]MDH6484935.1 AcrR family transcriptional regulator [Streptomyces sp. SAI-127]